MKALKVSIVIAIIFFTLLFAGFLSLYFYPISFKPLIETQLSKALDRKVTIKGEVRIGLGFRPKIIATDLHLAPSKKYRTRQVERIKQLELSLLLRRLLFGQISIAKIHLSDVDLTLARRGARVVNWDLSHFVKMLQTEHTFSSFKQLSLSNVKLRYRDLKRGKTHIITIDKVELVRKRNGQFKLSLNARAKKLPVSIHADIDRRAKEKETPFDVRVAFAGNTFTLKGKITPKTKGNWLTSQYTLRGNNMGALATITGENIPAINPINVKGALSARGNRYKTTVEGMMFDGQVKGRIEINKARTPAKIAIDINGKNINAEKMLLGLRASDDMVGGKLNFDINVTDARFGTDALFSEATGPVSLLISNARYKKNVSMMRFGRSETATTKLNCLLAHFTLDKGIANSEAIAIDTNDLSVVGKGHINFKDKTLNLSMRPKSKRAERNFMNVNIRVKGTIDDPRIELKKRGLLKTVLKVTVGVVSLAGLGAIVLVDLGVSRNNPCFKALR